ncbi:MAG: sulfotransferase [Bacteroidales bacterium]|nr:sulfotransferase [Bacteroidales bacterium]
MNKPNFFLLGAGRSGTTSLYKYLYQHPDVFLSDIKEPSFFCESFQVIKNPVNYFELFNGTEDKKAVGEASHVYLSNPKTAELLKLLFPDAKFIVILRNPVERAYSLYKHMIYYGYEKVGSFQKALNIETERYNSSKFKNNCPQYFYNYMYFRSGLYGEQLSRFFKFFDKSQFLIIPFKKLQYDSACVLNDIYSFLEISNKHNPDFKIYNQEKIIPKFPSLHYFIERKLYPFLKMTRLKFLYKIIKNVENSTFIKSSDLDRKIYNNLLRKYNNDLRLLYNLTGIKIDDL